MKPKQTENSKPRLSSEQQFTAFTAGAIAEIKGYGDAFRKLAEKTIQGDLANDWSLCIIIGICAIRSDTMEALLCNKWPNGAEVYRLYQAMIERNLRPRCTVDGVTFK